VRLDFPGRFATTAHEEDLLMSGLGWLSFLLVGLIAGWAAERLMGREHTLWMNLGVGVVGAYLGAFLFRLLGLATTNFIGALVVAIIGSVVLLAIVGAVRRRG
jgi:uncharacterized membrane protein YeaQ/YmgE (transglycosylase-associated protein family)